MDCCFNKGIPECDENTIIIPPASKTFITGFAASYYAPYPLILKDYISEEKFKLEMEKINDMSWILTMLLTYIVLLQNSQFLCKA